MRVHYPRTPHLPWSPGTTSDDVRVVDLSGLMGREVVVTEKLDGENTTLYADGLHARSLDSAHHPSRAWVKGLHGRIAAAIPVGWRVCGENVYARHSIEYVNLKGYFYAFSVWIGERCLPWDRTVAFVHRLGIPVPPVLWRGVLDDKALRALRTLRLDTARQEGYVVRSTDGFELAEFAHRVAKWVRGGHVRTDTHWTRGPVVANQLGAAAALWEVRSGASVGIADLTAALGMPPSGSETSGSETVDVVGSDAGALPTIVADAFTRLDLCSRSGDTRLAGVLAALSHGERRATLLPRLVAPLGLPLARRVADLVGLYPNLYRPYPDELRRAGLVRLTPAADLGVLHAVAGAVLAGRPETATIAEAREQVEWSALYAEEAGLLGEAPLEPLRAGLRSELRAGARAGTRWEPRAGARAEAAPDDAVEAGFDADVGDRCWAHAREAYARGRIGTVEEAAALTWRWRDGGFPRLIMMVGPAGSGKSSFVRSLSGVASVVSLDDLRAARGSRSDQRANAEILRVGLGQLDAAMSRGGTVVWDATSLTPQQRRLVHGVAERRDALITHAVLVISEDEVIRRNADREHRVPPEVLATQLARFCPPYPGEAHRTWYIGQGGTVDAVAGTICGGEE